MHKYRDRHHAGQVLAQHLAEYEGNQNVIVLALPRGGVPVAYEVAKSLAAPLDVFIVRKLGVPGHPELAMGALAMNGMLVFNQEIIMNAGITRDEIDLVKQKELIELQRRLTVYRGQRPYPTLKDKTVIVVDDGVATGASMRVALKVLRQFEPKLIVAAVPVADQSVIEELEPLADNVVCPLRPSYLQAVGAWYDDFSQTEDKEVQALLKNS